MQKTLTPGEEQALKHFDALLTAAQAVVNDAVPSADKDVVLADRYQVEQLRTIVQKISDEAVEIIERQSGEGNPAVVGLEAAASTFMDGEGKQSSDD